MTPDTWKTISVPAEGLYKEKGSRFISWIFPVANEEEVREILARLRKEYHGARHYCYAWRLGREKIRFRANDDGEPSSTAGKPILGQLVHHELTHVLLVVIRYFGGTLLGVSGLISAYREAAADAIRNAVIESRISELQFRLEFPYASMNQVMHLLKTENINQRSLHLDNGCRMEIGVRRTEAQRMLTLLGSLTGVTIVPPWSRIELPAKSSPGTPPASRYGSGNHSPDQNDPVLINY